MLPLLARLLGSRKQRNLFLLLGLFVGDVLLGAVLFALTQHRAFTTSVYWAITTATTVGYGDISPGNGVGRFIASALMLTAIPLLGGLFALMTGAAVASGVRRIMQLDSHFPVGSYRLIVGSHPTVPAIVEQLVAGAEHVVLVADIDPATLPATVHVVRGDPADPEVLRRARPAGAAHILVTAQRDGDVLVNAVLLRKQAPDVAMTALCRSRAVREALQVLGVDQVLSVDHLVSQTLAKSLETPHAGDLLSALLDSGEGELREVAVETATVGRQLSQVRADRAGLVLAVVHEGRLQLGITADPVLAAGDTLLIAEPAAHAAGN